jgi:hypothetical protein
VQTISYLIVGQAQSLELVLPPLATMLLMPD